jgi:hypothetical protein
MTLVLWLRYEAHIERSVDARLRARGAREDRVATMYGRGVTDVTSGNYDYDRVVREAGLAWAPAAQQKLPDAGSVGWENLFAPCGLKPSGLYEWYVHPSGLPLEWGTWVGQLVIESPQFATLVYCLCFASLGFLVRHLWVFYYRLKAAHTVALVRLGASQAGCLLGRELGSLPRYAASRPHRGRGHKRYSGRSGGALCRRVGRRYLS